MNIGALFNAMAVKSFGGVPDFISEGNAENTSREELHGGWRGDASFSCQIPVSDEFRNFLMGNLPKIVDKSKLPVYSLMELKPKPKRKINIALYQRRLKRATSIRKAKKYAKLLGYYWSKQLNRFVSERWICFPDGELSHSVNEKGEDCYNLTIQSTESKK